MASPKDRESEAASRALDAWARQQPLIDQTLRVVGVELERQLASIVSSIRLPVMPILKQLNFPQGIYAREVLAGLQIPQPSVDAALLRSVVAPASSIIAEALKPLSSELLVVGQLQRQMSEWMQSFYAAYEELFEPLRALAEGIGEGAKVKEAFEAGRLWIAPSMSGALVARVLKLHEEGAGPGVIASVVSRSYARGGWAPLVGAVERWGRNPLFKRRMPIFRDALEAHREGRFTLTVPTLVVQVEGICGQYVKRERLLPKLTGKTKRVVEAALRNAPCSLVDVERYAALDGVLTFVERHLYVVTDFDAEYDKLVRETSLRAHAIRHGHQERYHTRMNSLRLFLLLDVLSLLE